MMMMMMMINVCEGVRGCVCASGASDLEDGHRVGGGELMSGMHACAGMSCWTHY